jgi:hypothetical protein
MTRTTSSCRPARARGRRTGYTLIEILVSSTIATVLMGGLASSVYIANQAFESDAGAPAERTETDNVLQQLTRDVQMATGISELTATAVTLTVPDRDGDSQAETIRYAWSGTPGDPLTYQYNGGAAITIAEDVRSFNLDVLSRFMEGASAGTVLFVFSEAADLNEREKERVALIESWGYTVETVSSKATIDEFAKAMEGAHVAYVSGDVSPDVVSSQASGYSIGVVCEQYMLANTFGFSSGYRAVKHTDILILDGSHAITSGFKQKKWLTVLEDAWTLMDVDGGWANTIGNLAGVNEDGNPALAVFEVGDEDYNGRTVAGRRVLLPWGTDELPLKYLNDDGRAIMRRAIAWAAEPALAAESDDGTLKDIGKIISQPIDPIEPIDLDGESSWFEG